MTTLPAASAFQAEPMSAQALSDALVQMRDYLADALGTSSAGADVLAALGALVAGHAAASSARSVGADDRGRVIACTGTWALTLGAAATLGAGFAVVVANTGAGTITLTRSGGDLIDGAATAALVAGRAALVVSTGTGWITMALPGRAAGPLAVAQGGTGGTDQATARTGLGLGTAAVANTVTSTLDTTAGRVPTVGWMGLGGDAVQLSGTDSLASRNLVTGVYSYNGANITDGPEGSVAWVRTVVVQMIPTALAGGGNVRRLWLDFRSSSTGIHRMWVGSNQNNDAIAWREVFHQGSLLGTVSQSGGVPTGAVIERGSNDNGAFVRFADGTQICWQSFTVSDLAVTTVRGALFTTNITSPVFPAAFVGTPAVTLRGGFSTNVDGWLVMNGAPTTSLVTNGALRVFSAVSLTETYRWSYLAIGRWF